MKSIYSLLFLHNHPQIQPEFFAEKKPFSPQKTWSRALIPNSLAQLMTASVIARPSEEESGLPDGWLHASRMMDDPLLAGRVRLFSERGSTKNRLANKKITVLNTYTPALTIYVPATYPA